MPPFVDRDVIRHQEMRDGGAHRRDIRCLILRLAEVDGGVLNSRHLVLVFVPVLVVGSPGDRERHSHSQHGGTNEKQRSTLHRTSLFFVDSRTQQRNAGIGLRGG